MTFAENCDRKKLTKLGCAFLFVAVIVGLGIAELTIYVNGTKYTSRDEVCPVFPANLSNFSISIPIVGNIFHQRLYIDNFEDSWIQQSCPTVNYDSDLVLRGNLVSRTDTTFFSFDQEFSIKNCHSDNMYWAKTGGFEETLKNSFKIRVSMRLKNENQTKDLAFIRGESFFGDKIELIDFETEQSILYMEKSALSLTWRIQRRLLDHPGSDIRVIAALLGKRHLGKKDSCNGFFRGVAIFFLILAIILGCFLVSFLVFLFKKLRAKRNAEMQPLN